MGKSKRKRVKCWEDCLLPEYRVIDDNGCWIWTGSHVAHGYPIFRRNGKTILITRLSVETYTGKALGKLFALHHCDNPPCFNPEHLYAGTPKDNMRDCIARKRNTRWFGKSGITGITWMSRENKWLVARRPEGKEIRYGSYWNLDDAIKRNDEIISWFASP